MLRTQVRGHIGIFLSAKFLSETNLQHGWMHKISNKPSIKLGNNKALIREFSIRIKEKAAGSHINQRGAIRTESIAVI